MRFAPIIWLLFRASLRHLSVLLLGRIFSSCVLFFIAEREGGGPQEGGRARLLRRGRDELHGRPLNKRNQSHRIFVSGIGRTNLQRFL